MLLVRRLAAPQASVLLGPVVVTTHTGHTAPTRSPVAPHKSYNRTALRWHGAQRHPCWYSTGSAAAGESASTSTSSQHPSIAHSAKKRDASSGDSVGKFQRRKSTSWRSRRRLARLSANLASTLGLKKSGKDDGRLSPGSRVLHPSRPKKQELVRQRAKERWAGKRADAAAEGAVGSSRQQMEQHWSKPRGLRNYERTLAAQRWLESSIKDGQVRHKPSLEESTSEQHQNEMQGAAPSAPTLENSVDSIIKGDTSSKAAAKSKDDFKSKKTSTDIAVETKLLTGNDIKAARTVLPGARSKANKASGARAYIPHRRIPTQGDSDYGEWHAKLKWRACVGGVLSAADVPIKKVEPLRQMEVARLAHGIDRALFNPTVFWLREPRTGIYNFDPRIRNLYDVDMFDYKALPPYLTSSIDPELAKIAQQRAKKYTGSTSSLTGLLSQIYFCISANKQPRLTGFSAGFDEQPKGFSFGARLPTSILLRRFEEETPSAPERKSVRYAIDQDKLASGEAENSNYVLTQLGKSVEKLLTSEVDEYEKYLRTNSHKLSEEEKTKKEAYYYSESPKFLMRSQLDCSDDRLPRKTFDLKTRSVVAVRQDRANWVESSGYLIRHLRGLNESFERELWDMTRSAFLKYFFQARIGDMDGILVAYHSTAHVFGFQYIPREEMMEQLFSSVEMGEQAFALCIGMLERILDAATELYPDDSLRITIDNTLDVNPKLLVFVQPEGADPDDESQSKRLLLFEVTFDRYLSGQLVQGPVDFEAPKGYGIDAKQEDEIQRRKRSKLPPLKWTVEYAITPRSDLSVADTQKELARVRVRQTIVAGLTLPNVEAINQREAQLEKALSTNQEALERYFHDLASGEIMGMPRAPGQNPVMGVRSQHKEDRADQSSAAATSFVSIDDGDVDAANADLEEKAILGSSAGDRMDGDDSHGSSTDSANPYGVGSDDATITTAQPVRWERATARQTHLRKLARLGREDQRRLAKIDPLQMYERHAK